MNPIIIGLSRTVVQFIFSAILTNQVVLDILENADIEPNENAVLAVVLGIWWTVLTELQKRTWAQKTPWKQILGFLAGSWKLPTYTN